MKLGILANEGSWYYRDLARAANERGLHCERLDFERLVTTVRTRGASIRAAVDADRLTPPQSLRSGATDSQTSPQPAPFDVILVRTMPPGSLEQVVFRMDVLEQWRGAGTRIVNSPKSLECAVDKYLTTARLQAAGLPVPETVVCEHEDDAMQAFFQLGGDVVVKPLFGAEGRGIVRVTDPDLAHRTFRTLMRLDTVLYIQRFIDHGGGDVRVLVLDGQVIGSMKRRSPADFRTNVARDAIAEPHQHTLYEQDLAIAAAAATGTEVAGIDILYDRQGTAYVIEVNAVPGWQAFNRVNQADVAGLLISHLLK